MSTTKGLRQVITRRIARSKRDVFLTRDFKNLGNADQVTRALRDLIVDRVLLRLGKGVYAKARLSSISGRVVLANPGGFQVVAQEALTLLGVDWEPTAAQQAFAAGTSTQIPVNAVVKIKGRVPRKLRYGQFELVFDRSSGAPPRARVA